MPGHSMSPEMLEREMDELCGFITDFAPVAARIAHLRAQGTVADAARLTTRLQVMCYCHIVEADFPYLILLNLLRLLRGRDCCFTLVGCEYPHQKIQELQSLETTLETGVAAVLDRLLQRDLRNAFSHSQYAIDNDGALVATKWLSGVTGRPPMPTQGHTVFFTVEDVRSLYETSLAYFRTFVDCYRETIVPYKDGEFHSSELSRSPLRWDSARNQWTWQ